MDADLKQNQIYNSRIIDNYLKFIKKYYKHIEVNELIRDAGLKPYEVADQNQWFTQKQIDRFHEKLSQVTQNQNIAREAGRYMASSEASGVMRQYFLGMVGPETAYSILGKGARNFTKATRYETKKISSNKVEVIVSLKDGIKERPFQCDNRTGALEALAMLFQSKLPRVDHPECVHKGGSKCRYIFTFEKTLASTLKTIRNRFALPAFLLCIILSFFNLHLVSTILFPTTTAIVLLLTIIAGNREQTELRLSLKSLKYSTDNLLEQMEVNLNNLLLTNEIGQTLSKQTKSGDILFQITQNLKKRLSYDRCMILLADSEKKRLLFRAGYGYTEEQLKFLNKTAFNLQKPNSKGVFVLSFREQKAFLINNVSEIQNNLSLKSHVFAQKMGSQAFICCPIVIENEPIGILAVDNLKSKKPLVQSDLNLLTGIAAVLGISIHNAELLGAKERQFKSILQVLAASIDARDPMTSGHSEKVTQYALGICDELGLSEEYKSMIQVSALLHDYGKIGVPDSILKKPGKLTDEEYEIVKTHAEKTKRILNQVNFEGVFSQVPEVAGCHHEKIDGSGYPMGLMGDDIPLGAKVIAVADFFEAITARRHYRDPIPLKTAFQMLQEESGRCFDAKIVDALLRYYAKIHAGEPELRASLHAG